MTIGRKSPTTKRAMTVLLALALPTSALAGPSDVFYERSLVLEADARCDLFQPTVASALLAATKQARGAALRSGTPEPDLRATAQRARNRAASVSCADPQLALVRGRVEHAFAGWTRMPRMTFVGSGAQWNANRVAYDHPSWRLMQTSVTGASPVTVGYNGLGTTEPLTAVVSFVGRPRPYAARIVMRDTLQSPRAWIGRGELPPESMRASHWSSGSAPAASSLLSEGRTSGEAWRFDPTVAQAIERLDPRERFVIEFHFRDDSIARASFEAGDFAAGRAFIAMGAL